MTAEPLTPGEVASFYAARLPGLTQKGHRWRGRCPIHAGHDNNFSVDPQTGLWCCHSRCGTGGSIFDLEAALAGVGFPAARAAVYELVGRRVQRYRPQSPRVAAIRAGALEQAQRWQRGAVGIAEGILGGLKARLFVADESLPVNAIARQHFVVEALKGLRGAALVNEHQRRCAFQPDATRLAIETTRVCDAAAESALRQYLFAGEGEHGRNGRN
jgi:hypothetical protein